MASVRRKKSPVAANGNGKSNGHDAVPGDVRDLGLAAEGRLRIE